MKIPAQVSWCMICYHATKWPSFTAWRVVNNKQTTEVSLLGGKQNNTHNNVMLTANYNNGACTTIKYLKTSIMYIEIHPQCTWQKSYMTSPQVITIALWELLSKILFLWKMSQCGNQNVSPKCISFDYYYYYFESRGKKEHWQPKELHPYSSGGGFP